MDKGHGLSNSFLLASLYFAVLCTIRCLKIGTFVFNKYFTLLRTGAMTTQIPVMKWVFCGCTKFAKFHKHILNETKACWHCALNLIQLANVMRQFYIPNKEVAFIACLSLSRPLWSFLPLEIIIIILTCIRLLALTHVLSRYQFIVLSSRFNPQGSQLLKDNCNIQLTSNSKQNGLVDCVPHQWQ